MYNSDPLRIYEVPLEKYWKREFRLDYPKPRYVQYLGNKKVGESVTKTEFVELLHPVENVTTKEQAENILKAAKASKAKHDQEREEYEAALKRKRNSVEIQKKQLEKEKAEFEKEKREFEKQKKPN